MAFAHYAAADDDAYDVGYEEGKLLLPSHVLSEAFDTKLCLNDKNEEQPKEQPRSNGGRRQWIPKRSSNYKMTSKSKPRAPAPRPPPPPSPYAPLYQNPNYVNGGPGTQMFFLDSYRAPSGTGVFIPQRPYTRSSMKPARAPNFSPRLVQARRTYSYIPVFIPYRVAQALNLDAYSMGIPPIPPTQVPEFSTSWGEVWYDDSVENNGEEEKDDDAAKQCVDDGISAESQISYPGITVPEEWSYY